MHDTLWARQTLEQHRIGLRQHRVAQQFVGFRFIDIALRLLVRELPALRGVRDNAAVVRLALTADQEPGMSAVIIEHVNVAELPDAWRARLPVPRAALVTVRIETEDAAAAWPAGFFSQVASGWCGELLTRSPQGTITPRAALD